MAPIGSYGPSFVGGPFCEAGPKARAAASEKTGGAGSQGEESSASTVSVHAHEQCVGANSAQEKRESGAVLIQMSDHQLRYTFPSTLRLHSIHMFSVVGTSIFVY